MSTQAARAQRFYDLHQSSGVFVMPNAWDAGSARMLAAQGFSALGTTSAGIAFSLGVPDAASAVSRDEMLAAVARIARSVELPVSTDLESGYGDGPDDVGETITLAIAAGAVGANIEDTAGDPVERIRAARAAADRSGIAFTLTARTDTYLQGVEKPFAESVRRANLYQEAGADCLFVPGVSDPATIGQLVREIDGPLTVVMGLSGSALTVAQLEDLGVRRISIGGSLARAVFGLIRDAAQEIAAHGTFDYARRQIPHTELCAFFAEPSLPALPPHA